MNLKSLLLAIAINLAIVGSVRADVTAPEKIAYLAQVPLEIRKDAKSRKFTCFFGKTVIEGQNLALHFYDLQRPKTDENGQTSQKSCLDIYLESRSNNRSVYRRINAVPFVYFRPEAGTPEEKKLTIQAEKLWLVPGTKTQPIFHLALNILFSSPPQETGDAPYESESGLDALFIFPQGLTGEAVVQQFDTSSRESSFESPGSFKSNDFSTLDKEGHITVFREWLHFDWIDYEGWKWNGTRFIEVDKASKNVGEVADCKWDGEKITKTVYGQS